MGHELSTVYELALKLSAEDRLRLASDLILTALPPRGVPVAAVPPAATLRVGGGVDAAVVPVATPVSAAGRPLGTAVIPIATIAANLSNPSAVPYPPEMVKPVSTLPTAVPSRPGSGAGVAANVSASGIAAPEVVTHQVSIPEEDVHATPLIARANVLLERARTGMRPATPPAGTPSTPGK